MTEKASHELRAPNSDDEWRAYHAIFPPLLRARACPCSSHWPERSADFEHSMFLIRRPSTREIEEFIKQSIDLPLSYDQIGLAKQSPSDFSFDQARATIGQGKPVFERSKLALREWRHFEMGWVEIFPKNASIEPGTTLAVLVHHLGFWSLNGCRVVYELDKQPGDTRFGFAYGTLTNHAEMGEEVFEVSISPESEEVSYCIRAASKPRAVLARMGYPLTRLLQARFRRGSLAAMQHAVGKQ